MKLHLRFIRWLMQHQLSPVLLTEWYFKQLLKQAKNERLREENKEL